MFGSHVKCQETLTETMLEASLADMKSIQIFLGSPYLLSRRKVSQDDLSQASTLQNMNVFTHLPYVHNFAGVAKLNALAYQGNVEVDDYVHKCAKSVQSELETLSLLRPGCSGCRRKGCVLHIGSVGTKGANRAVGLANVARTINHIDFANIHEDTPLLLETMVGRGGVLGTSFDELAQVYANVQDKSRVGFCLDTCHVYANGNYNLSNPLEVVKMFEDFDRVLPAKSLQLIHLNDSKTAFRSYEDKHADLKTGYIWKENDRALIQLLQIAKSREIPVVLETSEIDFATLKKLQALL